MAQQPPPIHFEDIPLAEARTMSRGPRMDPELYHAFKEKIESLGNTATRVTLPEGTSPTTMKDRILRAAAELNTAVTVRRVPGGLLFWRSTAEDLAHNSVHRPEVEIGGTLANFSTVIGPFFDRFAEVEPNEDARIRILGRRLGEAGIRAEHW
jgi:hypothetical protein